MSASPLFLEACAAGDLTAAAQWLDQGADPNYAGSNGFSALMAAASTGAVSTVEFLLGCESINPIAAEPRRCGGRTALHYAAINGNHDVVEALLAAGDIDPDAADAQKMTALHLAARAGHLETVSALLRGGADAAAVDRYSQTARFYAEEGGHDDIAFVLPDTRAALHVNLDLDDLDDGGPVVVYFKKKKRRRRAKK